MITIEYENAYRSAYQYWVYVARGAKKGKMTLLCMTQNEKKIYITISTLTSVQPAGCLTKITITSNYMLQRSHQQTAAAKYLGCSRDVETSQNQCLH